MYVVSRLTSPTLHRHRHLLFAFAHSQTEIFDHPLHYSQFLKVQFLLNNWKMMDIFSILCGTKFLFLICIDMSKTWIDSHAFLLARNISLANKTKRTRKNVGNPFECFRMDSLFLLKWKSKVHTTEYEHCGCWWCCQFFFLCSDQI